jgi:hypothetical protein
MVCVNADAPVGANALPRIGDKYAPAPANAALVNTSFKFPPLANVTPALSAAAPTILAVAVLAPNHVPIAGIHAGAKIAIAGMIMGATFLTNFLNPEAEEEEAEEEAENQTPNDLPWEDKTPQTNYSLKGKTQSKAEKFDAMFEDEE